MLNKKQKNSIVCYIGKALAEMKRLKEYAMPQGILLFTEHPSKGIDLTYALDALEEANKQMMLGWIGEDPNKSVQLPRERVIEPLCIAIRTINKCKRSFKEDLNLDIVNWEDAFFGNLQRSYDATEHALRLLCGTTSKKAGRLSYNDTYACFDDLITDSKMYWDAMSKILYRRHKKHIDDAIRKICTEW